MTNKRVTTGIKGLDEMLHGGFIRGSMILVRGAPGTGKTSLALQYLIHGAKHNKPGLFISFEELPNSLYRDARTLGWDLKSLEDEGKLYMLFTSPEVFLASIQTPNSRLNQLLLDANIRRLALDSVSHFDRLTSDSEKLRDIYTSVNNGLRREGITAMLLGEEGRAMYQRAFKGGISFIVDTIVMLRYVEVESAMQRAIMILKMRGSNHAKEIRRYEIKTGGLEILDVFEGREGLLSGISHRVTT